MLTSCRISAYLVGSVFFRVPSVIRCFSLHARQLNETANGDAGEGRTSQASLPLFDSILRAIAVLCVVWLQVKLGLSCRDLLPRQGLQSPRPATVYYQRPSLNRQVIKNAVKRRHDSLHRPTLGHVSFVILRFLADLKVNETCNVRVT